MKKNSILKTLIVVSVSIFFLVSCGLPPPGTPLTHEERERAKNSCIAQHIAGGAILGGITGALLGGSGKAGKGAIIGALSGAALGYLIAYGRCIAYFSDLNTFPVAGYQDTLKKEGYRAELGEVVKIKSFSSSPREVNPGNKLKLDGSYFVMAPKEVKEVKVKETRTLYYFDSSKKEWVELGSAENEITSDLGTRKAEGTIEIPKELPAGRYRIDFRVEALGKNDVASTEYVVRPSTVGGGFFSTPNLEG